MENNTTNFVNNPDQRCNAMHLRWVIRSREWKSFGLGCLQNLLYCFPHDQSLDHMASDVLIFNWIINHFYSICGFQGTYLMYVRSTKLEKTSLSFTNGLALNSSVALRLILIKLLSANGDGEIRTLDPLLARQVLSQLSYTPIWSGTHLLSHTVSSIVPSAA